MDTITSIIDQTTTVAAMKPQQWAERWGCDFLEPIPILGFANASTWRGTAPGSTRAPGKNHPDAGAWLIEQYCPDGGHCADPMFGIGGLWINAPHRKVSALQGCEIESHLQRLAQINIQSRGIECSDLTCSDATEWNPELSPDLVLFSPPFLQNHSAGSTAHQRQILERKNLHTMQEFGSHPGNLGRKKNHDFWSGMEQVYANVCKYVKRTGYVIVILRNRILKGREADEIGRHISLLRSNGFDVVGVHARDLQRPTGYQAWKVAKDPNIPWIRYEWAVVARRNE